MGTQAFQLQCTCSQYPPPLLRQNQDPDLGSEYQGTGGEGAVR